jgi:hypothetical protein
VKSLAVNTNQILHRVNTTSQAITSKIQLSEDKLMKEVEQARTQFKSIHNEALEEIRNINKEHIEIKGLMEKDINEELKVIKFAEESNHREAVSHISSLNKQQLEKL